MGRTRKPAADSTAAERKPARPAWVVVLAERGPDGEWRTVGEPLPNVAFDTEPDAYAYSMKRNRQWNAKFSWEDDPPTGFVAVRADALGRLRSHKPVGEPPPERLPVGQEPKTGLAPARRGRPRERVEDVEDNADDADDEYDGEQDQDEETDQDGTEDDEDGHADQDEAGQLLLTLG